MITQLTLSSYISIWFSIDWPVVFLVANVQATKAIYLFILENLSLISLYIYSMLDKGTKSWLLIDCTANVRLIIYISQHPNTQAGHRTSPVVLAFLRSLQTPHHTIQHEYEGRGVCGGLASTIMVVLLCLVVASPPVVQCKCALIIQVFYHWLINWLPACLSLSIYMVLWSRSFFLWEHAYSTWYCEAGRLQELADVVTTRRHMSLRKMASNNATTHKDVVDESESKVVLKFCLEFQCQSPKVSACYCCINQKPEENCYDSMKECQAGCPTCKPKCPP